MVEKKPLAHRKREGFKGEKVAEQGGREGPQSKFHQLLDNSKTRRNAHDRGRVLLQRRFQGLPRMWRADGQAPHRSQEEKRGKSNGETKQEVHENSSGKRPDEINKLLLEGIRLSARYDDKPEYLRDLMQ